MRLEVIQAEAMGLCFGVRDALALAYAEPDPASVTIHGELVHNEIVLRELDALGYRRSPEDARALPATPKVLVTAHGISDRERARLGTAGLQLLDTTCPLVRKVHEAAQALQAEGRHVLVIGRPGHVEVRGIVEDLASYDVISAPTDVRDFGQARLGIVCQTTVPIREARALARAIRAANPAADVRFCDTVCAPTKQRQTAVEQLAQRVDAIVVVGGKNSNNTKQLVELCTRLGVRACHVQTAADLDMAWFSGCRRVGLTAGTSTPDATIDAVAAALAQIDVANGSRR